MISRKLSHLAGKVHAAIGEENLGLADPARIEDDLPRRRIAGVVFVTDAEVEIAERDPDPLAAPAHVQDLALERQVLGKCRAGLRRRFSLERLVENERTGRHYQYRHR